jgi:multidrug efflux system membrane fusion protein
MDEATYLRYAQAAAGGHVQVPVKLGLLTEKSTEHEGRIESFDNRLDPASGTIRVRAVFQNPDGVLVPGLFAKIRIADIGTSRVLLVNDRAIGTDQDKKFVLALGKDNMTEYKQVKIGPPVDGLRVVEEGLKAGDKVVISGLSFMLRPGMPVAPNMVAMDAPPGPPPGAPPAPEQKPEDGAKPDAAAKPDGKAPEKADDKAEKK